MTEVAEATKDAGTFTYFVGVKSRGEPIQMIAKYGGVDLKLDLITNEQWAALKSGPEHTIPFITNPDGLIMCETEVICKHLATMGGKLVVDAKQAELCTIANHPPMAWSDALFNLPDEVSSTLGCPSLDEWVKDVAPVLKDLAAKLGDGPFFAGESPGYAELYLFHRLDIQFAIAKEELSKEIGDEAMGKLEAFYAKVAELDGVKEHLAGRPTAWGMPGSRANPA